MQTIQIIPFRSWVHSVTGAKASVYGSIPWTSAQDKDNWEIVTSGYTWEVVDTFGAATVGLCRVPAKTLSEAQDTALQWKAINPEHREIIS